MRIGDGEQFVHENFDDYFPRRYPEPRPVVPGLRPRPIGRKQRQYKKRRKERRNES